MTFRALVVIVIVIVIIILPIIGVASAELRWKGLVKEVSASRERPSTHINHVAFLKTSFVYYIRLWINVDSLGWKDRGQDLLR